MSITTHPKVKCRTCSVCTGGALEVRDGHDPGRASSVVWRSWLVRPRYSIRHCSSLVYLFEVWRQWLCAGEISSVTPPVTGRNPSRLLCLCEGYGPKYRSQTMANLPAHGHNYWLLLPPAQTAPNMPDETSTLIDCQSPLGSVTSGEPAQVKSVLLFAPRRLASARCNAGPGKVGCRRYSPVFQGTWWVDG